MTTPAGQDNQRWDRSLVSAVIAEADAAHGAQVLLVDRLRVLLEQQEHELNQRRDRAAQLRRTWAEKGVVIS